MAQNHHEHTFSNKIKGSVLPVDTFLESLRTFLFKNGISSFQSQEKTGEAHTTAIGATLGGHIAGGLAHTNIMSNKWNPFNIKISAKKYAAFGYFKGSIKLNEIAKYHKKKEDKHFELKDYHLEGSYGKFTPYGGWLILMFFIGLIVSISTSVGAGPGFWITIAFPIVFYIIFSVLGNGELNVPAERIKESIKDLETFLTKHNKETME